MLSLLAWKEDDECAAADGDWAFCCSLDDVCGDVGVASLSDRGRGSPIIVVIVLLRLSAAILEDGGTGRIGIGRMGLEGFSMFNTLSFSACFSGFRGRNPGFRATGKEEDRVILLTPGLGWGRGRVSIWASSMDGPIYCKTDNIENIETISSNWIWRNRLQTYEPNRPIKFFCFLFSFCFIVPGAKRIRKLENKYDFLGNSVEHLWALLKNYSTPITRRVSQISPGKLSPLHI